MAGDKKGKNEHKKAKAAEKRRKQEKKGLKKEKTKHLKENESDNESVDLEAVLAKYARDQEQFLKITEISCDPPKPRSSASLISSPKNSNELFLFGGEYFDGTLATFFNDLYVYIIDRDEWHLVKSPNTPLPRSGHAWCRGGNLKTIFLFGGEFSSPKQGTFYHYNDFWQLDPSTREWTRIEVKGKSPPARSGHRMTYYKNYVILFGGFQDTSQYPKYLADIWIFDTKTYAWYNPPNSTQTPDARSSFSFLPHENGAILFGGYSRVKVTVPTKLSKAYAQSRKNVFKPIVHQDCFFLRINEPTIDMSRNVPLTVNWERRKRPANLPNPPRAGATMTYHRNRGILFAGVHDVEENEERIDSQFFNELYAWNIERNRFFPLTMRKPRLRLNKIQGEGRGGRRARGQANEEDLLKNLEILEAKNLLNDNANEKVNTDKITPTNLPEKKTSIELPHVRFNALLTVQDDMLYIYGGTFEKGDREFTLNDMYAIDLDKLDGVKEVFCQEPENWFENDTEGSDEDTENEYIEEESSEKCDSDTESLHPDSKIQSEGDEITLLHEDDRSQVISTDGDITNEIITRLDDNIPHPRPFETRREFFQRTSNEWQKLELANLKLKGMLSETLSIKEIKAKAFEMSENLWWECREEIMILEDEQEVAGIGEIIDLASKGGTSGSLRKR